MCLGGVGGGQDSRRAGGQVPNEECLLALFCQSPDKMDKYILCGKSVLPQKTPEYMRQEGG